MKYGVGQMLSVTVTFNGVSEVKEEPFTEYVIVFGGGAQHSGVLGGPIQKVSTLESLVFRTSGSVCTVGMVGVTVGRNVHAYEKGMAERIIENMPTTANHFVRPSNKVPAYQHERIVTSLLLSLSVQVTQGHACIRQLWPLGRVDECATTRLGSFSAVRLSSRLLTSCVQPDQESLCVPISIHYDIVTTLIFKLCYYMVTDEKRMATVTLTREERGRMIAETPNQIERLGERFYRVTSQSGNGTYMVTKARMNRTIGWVCECPDFTYREVKCKHIWAVEFSQALRNKVKESVVIEPLSPNICPYCTSKDIMKRGVRHNRYGDLQRFSCRACGKRFVQNIGFERMGATPQAITSAMQLYFTGESFPNIQKFLSLQGVNVHFTTVYRWIKKYVKIMERYLDQLQPQVSDTWRADELFLKVRGNMKYLYALMDDETRFWIAQQVADTKYHADIHEMFHDGRKVAGKAPHRIITDGAMNFGSAINDEFWREKRALAIVHDRDIRFGGEIHNNTHVRRWLLLRLTRADRRLLSDSFQPNVWTGAS
jgi:transposase-like protein